MVTASQPTKIGKYEILSTLGRGGMGVVYKARDPIIDRIVAIKTILVGEETAGDESLLDRLHMEARSAGRLHHPNIVTVFDFGQQDEMSYIVMEYVEGINLARLIDERKVVALDTKVSILIQIADGLGYAHEHGVVHRDMKPSNVCVTSDGTAKILDFGLARFDSTRLTKTGYMAGTIAYMSPERLSGETGTKDDIFALGAISYELLTYKRAFPGTMAPEVISRIIAPEAPALPSEVAGLPVELDPVVLKALAKDTDARYDSASALAEDLRRALHSDVLHDFVVNERRATLGQSKEEFIDRRPSSTAYAGPSSGKRAIGLASTTRTETRAEDPTQVLAPQTAVVPDVKAAGARTAPALNLDGSSAPTQVIRSRSTRWRWAAAAVVVVLAAVWIGIGLRKPAPASRPATVTTRSVSPPATQTAAVRDPLAERSELQLATARTLSEQIEGRSLNRDEMLRLSEAKARIGIAEKKLKEKDYSGGARLISDSIAGLQAVISSSDKRMKHEGKPAVERPLEKLQPRPAVATATAPPIVTPATPLPVPLTQTARTVVEARPPAGAPAHAFESPEKEIAAFMHRLAVAYQSKDVGFFREHSQRFSDEMGKAIQNSPSVRVDLQIVGVDLRDARHASVHVRRTDWFPDPGALPATQALVYNLERDGSGWSVASMSRD